MSFRPAPISLAIGPLWFWAGLVVAASAGAATHARWDPERRVWPVLASLLVLVGVLRLGWEIAYWFGARYRITDRRAYSGTGVLTRRHLHIPLDRVQHVNVVRRVRDRLAGVGSVGVATAGTGGTELWWVMISDPHRIADAVRSAAERARHARETPAPGPVAPVEPTPAPRRPVVIGLTGTIASGKSTAAGIFRDLGCLVIDSDAQTRAALDRPDVRDTLASWWGRGVLDREGRVDRKAVAGIVFNDPGQRQRLEKLVHPLIRASRADLIEKAHAAGKRVVVVDAPLLLEAGVNRECDAVVMIDAPRDQRLRRVADRGWDDAELTRRESAQWPAGRKASAADSVVMNDGTIGALRAKLTDALDRIMSAPPRPAHHGPSGMTG